MLSGSDDPAEVIAECIRQVSGTLESSRLDKLDSAVLEFTARYLGYTLPDVSKAGAVGLRHRIAELMQGQNHVFQPLENSSELLRVWTLTMAEDRSWASLNAEDDLRNAASYKTWQRRMNGVVAPAVGAHLAALGPFEATTPETAASPRLERSGDGRRINNGLVLAMVLGVILLGVLAVSRVLGTSDFYSCEDLADLAITDCEALVDLYETTGGNGWAEPAGREIEWFGSDLPCSQRPGERWRGVTCSGGRISGLDLAGIGLSGALPQSFGQLSGLTTLNLRDNDMGGQVPDSVIALLNLSTCDLSFNSWDLAATNARAIEFLDASCGGWNTRPFSSCANSTGISEKECEVLVDIWREAGGTNWLPSQWNDDPKKNWLVTNSPCGGPEFGWSSVLCRGGRVEALYLGEISLSGQLPESIGELEGLKELWAYDNDLTGPVPESLVNLNNLGVCALHDNQFDEEQASIGLRRFLDARCESWAG